MRAGSQATRRLRSRCFTERSTPVVGHRQLGSLVTDEDRAAFVDGWIRALVAKGDRTARLAVARVAIVERRERIGAQVRRIRARRASLPPRRDALLNGRQRLLG